MGGGKQGEPTTYEEFHKEMHAWMLTEDDLALSDTNEFDPATATSGAVGAFNASRSTAIGQTPYAAVGVFNPESPGNRYDVMVDETDKYVDLVQESIPEESFEENAVAILDKIDTEYDSDRFSDSVDDFNIEQDIQRTADLARKDDILSQVGNHAIVARSMITLLLDEERDRTSEQFSARLHYEHQVDRRNLTIQSAFELIDNENVFLAVRSQSINALMQSANLFGKASRQALEDELRLAVEDILWDAKLIDFMNKALGAITGVSIIPQGAYNGNSTLNTISTIAGILGAIIP